MTLPWPADVPSVELGLQRTKPKPPRHGRAPARTRNGSRAGRVLAGSGSSESTRRSERSLRARRARAGRGRRSARAAGAGERGPLLGIPIALKDNVDLAGEVTTQGSRGSREPAHGLLRALGHEVRHYKLDQSQLLATFTPGGCRHPRGRARASGRARATDVADGAVGERLGGRALRRSSRREPIAAGQLNAASDEHHLVMTPTTASAPPAAEISRKARDPRSRGRRRSRPVRAPRCARRLPDPRPRHGTLHRARATDRRRRSLTRRSLRRSDHPALPHRHAPEGRSFIALTGSRRPAQHRPHCLYGALLRAGTTDRHRPPCPRPHFVMKG